MKKQRVLRLAVIATISFLFLVGCTDSDKEAPVQSNAAPAVQSQPANTGGGIPKNGKVVKAMHAGGYTYMQLENHGKQFWIAATMMNVKRNDQVAWADAAVMKNFTSSSMRRTFEEILFVSAAKVQ